MAGQLNAQGFQQAAALRESDVIILHSCVVTRPAEQMSLRTLRKLRRQAPQALLVFCGCATKVLEKKILSDQGADLVVSQEEKSSLVSLILGELKLAWSEAGADRSVPYFNTTRAWLKVQDGCDFRCAYCIVPTTRGQPVSRPLEEILEEAQALAQANFRELVLTGVNLGCYGEDTRSLPQLVKSLLDLPESFRIRLSSLEPGTVENEIAALMQGEPRLCRMLHLPLQSGDDKVLRTMRRRYTVAQYESTLETVLERIPLVGLGTDVIVGFPGETETAFRNTMQLLERYPFSNLHIFPYSERQGTVAAELEGSVPVELRRERATMLRELADKKRRDFANVFLGRAVETLVERVDAKGVGRGWTGEYVEAQIQGLTPADKGTLLNFIPDKLSGSTLVRSAQ